MVNANENGKQWVNGAVWYTYHLLIWNLYFKGPAMLSSIII